MQEKRLEIAIAADSEIIAASDWYAEKGGETLAEKWVSAVYGMTKLVQAFPKIGTETGSGKFRTLPVHGFPYLLVYQELAHKIRLVHVIPTATKARPR